MAGLRLYVCTVKGLYMLESSDRRRWRSRGPYLRSESVNAVAVSPDAVIAATLTGGVARTTNGGKSWSSANDGLHIRKAWTVTVDPHDPARVYCGTHYSHVFFSDDGGGSWQDMAGLYTVPGRERWPVDWAWGTIGNCVHSIIVDARAKKKLYAVSSAGGVLVSADRGLSWATQNDGLYDSCPLQDSCPEHLSQVHSCVHAIRKVGRTIYQQNHCGVYRFDAAAARWCDISQGLPSRHGFPLAVDHRDARVAYVIPADQEGQCKRHNSCIDRQLIVGRTRNRGRSWERLTAGLPDDLHTCVLRHAFDADQQSPLGLYFGTTTGELFASTDAGDSWQLLKQGLPRIQGVMATVTG